MSEMERSQKLVALARARALMAEAEALLKILPQGEGSELDADTIDGLHAAEIIAKAVAEVVAKVTQKLRVGGGGGGPKYTDAKAVAAVEAEDPLTLKNVTMTGDLDLASNKLLFADTLIKQLGTDWIALRNRADDAYRGLYCSTVVTTGDFGMSNTRRIKTQSGGAFNYYLSAWDVGASALENVAVVQGHATDPYFEILKGGNIIPAVDNTYTIGDGATKNPSAVYAHRFVTVGHVQAGTYIRPGIYSDATRPAPGNVSHVIYNTTDGNLNIDDGFQWILPDGTPT
jgi:hypothetical protein